MLSIVDVSNQGKAATNQNLNYTGSIDQGKAENSLLNNELNQISYISQLIVGFNVYQLLFFQLSGLINKDRI